MPGAPVDVILVTIGSAGDLFPLLRIGGELHAQGHRVTCVAPWLHQPYVEQAGLAFRGVDIDEAVLDDPDLWHPVRGVGVVWRATRPAMAQVAGIVDGLLTGPRGVIVAHPLALPESDLVRAAHPGVKVVAAILAPQNLPSVHEPMMAGPRRVPRWVPFALRRLLWRAVGAFVLDPIALPDLNAKRSARGLAPVDALLPFLGQVADLTVLLFPAWFAPPQPDWPHPLLQADFALYDPNADAVLADRVRDFLAAGAAPLVFTHGTGNRQARGYFGAARDAALALGRRAILLTPYAQQVPADLPPSILWLDYVPLRALLPHAALVAHHGGIGTTAEALRAGTPQLVVPMAHDQFDNAERVKSLGAGARLDAARVTATRLTHALRNLLADPGLGQRCAQVASRFDDGARFRAACAQLVA